MNSYTTLLTAIRQKDWTSATERFRDIMEQKIALRLAEEKKHVAGGALREESADQCTAKHKGGAVCRLKAGHDGKHQATAGEAHYMWEASDRPGFEGFSVSTDAGYTSKAAYLRMLADAGITGVKAEPGVYVGHTLFYVPTKFAKKAERILLG